MKCLYGVLDRLAQKCCSCLAREYCLHDREFHSFSAYIHYGLCITQLAAQALKQSMAGFCAFKARSSVLPKVKECLNALCKDCSPPMQPVYACSLSQLIAFACDELTE